MERRNGKILVDKKMGVEKERYGCERALTIASNWYGCFASAELFLWEINKGSWRTYYNALTYLYICL